MSILLLLPSLLLACNEYEIKPDPTLVDGVDEDGVPDILVDPSLIAFGAMDVGGGATAIQTVTVTNEGTVALQIQEMTLADSEGAVAYTLSAIGAVLVPAGSSTAFTVTFEPLSAAEYVSQVLISSNDPDEPQVAVDLTGSGQAPVIALSPTPLDYGTMYIGCDLASAINISNIGNAPLVVSDFDYVSASDDLTFDDNEATHGALPWTIPAGASLDVYVAYEPLDDYADEGFLTVSSNDPFQPEAQAHQSGSGALYGANLDVFEQPIRGSSDILFVIDNSCSMSNEQTSLQTNFAYFAAGLVALDLDYQLAVITTDNPAFQGEIIDNDTDDIESEFITQAGVGIGGSGTEMPSEMAYQSTQSGGDSGPGSDFLRDDSMLSLIFVSDEPDSSPSSWSTYLSWFESVKSDSDDFVAHAISGDWPGGCSGSSATNNVYELTVATGGLYLSVCATDWASHLEALVEGSVEDLSAFELSAWPVPETIVVRIDGVTTTTGWEYNATSNDIEFEESYVPEGGSTIEVEYALFGECEG